MRSKALYRLSKYTPFIAWALLVLSLPFYSQNDTAKAKSLSFDIGFTRGQNIDLWPIFKRFRNEDKKELQVFYPIFSSKRDYKLHNRHEHFVPFYISDSSSQGVDRRLLSLYYPSLIRWQRRYDSLGDFRSFRFMELAPHVSLLGFWKTPGGLTVENSIFFFIWFRKDIPQKKTNLVVFPLYWDFTNKKDTTKVLFPFYFNRRTENSRYLNVALLYNQRKTPFERRRSLLPLFWHKTLYSAHDTTKTNFIFPLYFASKDRSEKRSVLFPLIYDFRDPVKRSFTFFPFYSEGENYIDQRKYKMITPLYWNIHDKEESFTTLFPFYWHSENYYKRDTTITNVIFPFVFTSKGKDHDNRVFFPFIYSFQNKDRSHFTFFPFYSKGSEKDGSLDYFAATPLFWHIRSKKEGTMDVLFPIYWKTQNYRLYDTINRTVLFPIVWRSKSRYVDRKVVFPFIFDLKDPDHSSFTFFPFYSKGSSTDSSGLKYLAITPLYWRYQSKQGSGRFLFPLFIGRTVYRDKDTIRKNVVFPFYWSSQSRRKNNKVLFPFIFNLNNEQQHSFTIFPFYSEGGRNNGSSAFRVVTPFYWDLRSKFGKAKVLFPLYWDTEDYYKNDTAYNKVLFPFYWSSKRKNEYTTVAFPFLFKHDDPRKSSFTFFPFYSHGYRKDRTLSYTLLTPFYWHIKDGRSIANVLFPIYWSERNGKDRYNILLPVYFRIKNEYRTSVTLFPIFSYGKRSLENKEHLVITPFFWHIKNRGSRSDVLFPLFWQRKTYLKNDTITSRIFFPLYWTNANKKRATEVFFPLFYKFRNERYRSITFIPLVSFGKGINRKSGHLMVTPFFGRFYGEKRENVFLFPIFNYRKSGEEKHFSAFLFLFRHTEAPNYSKTSFLWPFVEHEKINKKSKFRIAPVFWTSKTDTSRMTFLFPLFYNYKSDHRKTFVLSLMLYKRERITGRSVSNSILFRTFYSKKYVNGDFERRFLHLVIANVKVEGRREKAVLPFYHSVKEPNGSRSISYFFGLYNHFKEYKPEINDFYEEERILWFIRLRSNYKQLKAEGKVDFKRKRTRK
jgi:hypothetical protein